MVGQLRRGQIEPEHKRRGKAEDCGAAENGVDADEKADGDAPCELSGRSSHAEESEDRQDDAAVGPVVMDGQRVVPEDWVARRHS